MRYTTSGNEYKVAVVVSKKVAKHAPVRNKIRRRVYEVIRLLAPKYLTNQDLVITIFDDRFATMPYDELTNTLERQLQQICRTS
jgi:ribonuclease P protein component